jgi:ribonuclease HI
MRNNANEATLEALVAAIERLSPAQRRQLQRRLRVSGLFVPESAITDQDRLRVAPALGRGAQANRPQPTAPLRPSPLLPPQHPPPARGEPNEDDAKPVVGATAYRSPVSGKVVVGEPDNTPGVNDPHAMAPLPGQAPEKPIQIIFDGGSKGNPGQGYGSYALHWPGAQPQVVRLRFGNQVTNNEAEYDTLIAALEAVLNRLRDHGADPATARLDLRGDSLLVVNQVQGQWKIKEERLRTRAERVRQLLAQFGPWRLRHHDRSHSVEALGH